MRYLPYGEERWNNGASVTDFGFTAQRSEKSFGLMDYNARYYSPVLGRFISPDSIVPDPTSSSGFNRYRYARNNPLNLVDPTGHCGERYTGNEDCWEKYKELKGICPDCTSHRTAEGEDIPLERLNETQLDNLIQGFTGEYNKPAPPSGDGIAELIPSGAAWRFDASGMAVIGGDVNLDLTWLWESGEFDTLVSRAPQGGPILQYGGSTGPVVYWNAHSMESVKGGSLFGGSAIAAAEGEVAGGLNPDGSHNFSLYVGGGPEISLPIGYPVYVGVQETYSVPEVAGNAVFNGNWGGKGSINDMFKALSVGVR